MTDYKRGDEVLAWDSYEKLTEKSIFLAHIEGAEYSYICVDKNDEDKFRLNEEFRIINWKHIKPIPKTTTVELDIEDLDDFINELEGGSLTLHKVAAKLKKAREESKC